MKKMNHYQKRPGYQYELNEMEIKYKTLIVDMPAYLEYKEKLRNNDGYCLCKLDHSTLNNKCMCFEFRNSDSEGPCQCGVYKKVLRTEKEAEDYKKIDPKLQKELDKKEAALMKEMKKEEKLKNDKRSKEQDDSDDGTDDYS
jgi:hypothetical protein